MLKVFTYAYGIHGEKFIPLQYGSLKRHLQDDFDYTVFDTSEDNDSRNRIQNVCRSMNVRHVISNRGLASGSHPSGLIFSWREYALKEPSDLVLMLDFDMALMRPSSISKFMDGHDLAGIGQSRGYVKGGENIFYLWPGFIVWNMKTIPAPQDVNLDGGSVDGISVDVGGQLCYWLRAHPEIKYKSPSQAKPMPPTFDIIPEKFRSSYEDSFQYEVVCEDFLHFRAGSNWDHKPNDFFARKMQLYERILAG